MTTCPSCGHENPQAAKFCGECGRALQPPRGGDEATRLGGTLDGETVEVRPGPAGGGDEATRLGGALDGETVEVRPGRTDASDSPTVGLPTSAPFDPDQTVAGGAPYTPTPGHTPPPRTVGTTGGAARAAGAGPLSAGEAFGPRYHIIRQLGIGGMGAVYQAWDDELGVAVALKVIRPEVMLDPQAAGEVERRFKRELLLARQVTHKNVVRIHDLGEIDGIKYITMPYVEGSDLSSVLKEQDALPVERTLVIARGIVAGLQAAHDAGVVHRDLKPANIMIEEETGDALIMDFGIARAAGGPATSSPLKPGAELRRSALTAGQTMAGTIVGTVEYMAPEQARGADVDHRADLYAFGLILYDMLTGRKRAGRDRSAIAELQQRMQEPPPALSTIREDVPAPLERIVARCVAPDVEARYATTADLVADFDRLDDHGHLRPIPKRFTKKFIAAAVTLVAVALVGTWQVARTRVPPEPPPPMSVLIADFQNRTGEATFERTLEPILRLALEGAGFISAYDRSSMRGLGVRPPDTMDEREALEIAVRQGVNVVLSGSVDRDGGRYRVSVKATQPVTGNVVANATDSTSNRADVLKLAASLVEPVREALGDTTVSDSAQRLAIETLSATSLDAVHEYARGLEAQSANKVEEALQYFSRAVELDPGFGGAYGAMAMAARNLDRRQDAEKYLKEALAHLDSMTERERYRTRGLYYMITSDYQACVKEYGDLVARYSVDTAARNNRALCLTYLRDMPAAVEEMQQNVRILPNRTLYQENLAQYLAYSSDFAAAEQQARSIEQPGLFGMIALAFAQIGQGKVSDTEDTYRSLSEVDDESASYTASGLANVAIFEGRFSEAARLLSEGASADLESDDADRAADKFVALGQVELLRGRQTEAIAAAEQALATSQAVKIRFLAGRVFLEAGATARALALSQELGSDLESAPRAYAKILTGLAALNDDDPPRAVQDLSEANGLLDTWIGHYDLGRAYLEAGALLQADSEFDRCIKRRGEALSLFLDEEPTYGYFPPMYYYQGLVREAMKSTKTAESFRAYLDIRGTSTEDPLVPDARRRAEASEPR